MFKIGDKVICVFNSSFKYGASNCPELEVGKIYTIRDYYKDGDYRIRLKEINTGDYYADRFIPVDNLSKEIYSLIRIQYNFRNGV